MEVKHLQLSTKEEEEEALRESFQDGGKKMAHVLNLKPLPDHLKYGFLGQDETYLVIISADLSNQECERLLRVLRKHKEVIR